MYDKFQLGESSKGAETEIAQSPIDDLVRGILNVRMHIFLQTTEAVSVISAVIFTITHSINKKLFKLLSFSPLLQMTLQDISMELRQSQERKQEDPRYQKVGMLYWKSLAV